MSIWGHLPLFFKQLKIIGCGVVLESDLLAQCHYLVKLKLNGMQAHLLDLGNYWSLESVTLHKIWKLQTLLGLPVDGSSSLQSLKVWCCEDLVDIPGIDHLVGLKKLYIEGCMKLV